MRYISFILALIVTNSLLSQSKKKQIEILNFRIDSLRKELTFVINQKQILDSQIIKYNQNIEDISNQIERQKTENKDLNEELSKKREELKIANESIIAFKESKELKVYFWGKELQFKNRNFYFEGKKLKKSLQDSLNNLIRNKIPPAENYSYSFDRIFSNEIKEHLKKLVVKYPTYPESDDRYYTKNNTTLLDTRLFLENNEMKALLITIDRVPINEDTRPQLNINFFIIDCQNINKPSVIYKWSSLLPECPVDHDNDIIDIQFSDLNNDGNVEVWIVNEKYCMGGVDLTELLIFKYENGNHCTLQSMTNSLYIMNPETNATMDDDFIRNTHERDPLIFDQCFSNSDPIFLNYANHLREKNIYGKSGFRFEQDGIDNSKFWSRDGSQKNKIINEEIIENDTIYEILEKFKNDFVPESNGILNKIDTSKVLQKLKELSNGCTDCYWHKSIDLTASEELYFIHVVDLDHLYFVYNQVEYLIPLKHRSYEKGSTETGQPLNTGILIFEGSGFTVTSNWTTAGLSMGSVAQVEVKLKDKIIMQMSSKNTYPF
ncbi:MAG: hypothetical protein K9G36_01700 [Crocinitomicaceae bacterium]|nr:hypothetical protein [Crocinitomicaceae bacterium]